jgi:hypothetical protein
VDSTVCEAAALGAPPGGGGWGWETVTTTSSGPGGGDLEWWDLERKWKSNE